MRRTLPALSLLVASALVGCGGNNYGYGHHSNACDAPGFGTFAASNAAYEILAGAGFTVPPSQSNPFYAITSNGQGTYHLEFADLTGAATCFQGRVTVMNPFPADPIATNGTQAFVSPDGLQLAFSGVPGAASEYVEFDAGADVINVEGTVDGSTTFADFYFVDASTGVVAQTPQSIAAFISP